MAPELQKFATISPRSPGSGKNRAGAAFCTSHSCSLLQSEPGSGKNLDGAAPKVNLRAHLTIDEENGMEFAALSVVWLLVSLEVELRGVAPT